MIRSSNHHQHRFGPSQGGARLVGACSIQAPVDRDKSQAGRRVPLGSVCRFFSLADQTLFLPVSNWGGRNCSPLFYGAFNGRRHVFFKLSHHACKHQVQLSESHFSTLSKAGWFQRHQPSERPNNAVHEFPRTGSSYDC